VRLYNVLIDEDGTMAMIRQQWGWRKWAVVASLSILAGLTGVGSELIAASSSVYTLNGQQLTASWYVPGTNGWTDAGVNATSSVTGPGIPNPTGFAYSSGAMVNWSTLVETDYWLAGTFAASDLSVQQQLQNGSFSTTGELSGNLTTWNWSAGTVNTVNATGSINASLQITGTLYEENSVTRAKNKTQGYFQKTNLHATSTSDTSGSGGVTVVDANGNTYQFIAPGTATSSGTMSNIHQGTLTVTH
jgi:hypothetical protein